MNPNLPTWPDNLPQQPFGDTPPKYTPQNSTIRTSQETGPAKLRRRFTGRIHDITIGPLDLTAHQVDTLEEFICGKLGEVLPFQWTNFRTGQPAPYRCKNGWSSVTQEWKGTDSLGTEWWSVTLELEMLPA